MRCELSQIDNLLAVHDVDLRILAVERELKDIPVRKMTEETRISEHRKAVEKAESDLKSGQASAKEQESEIEALKEKIVKLRQQQFQIKTNEEFKAIEREISGIQEKIRGVEDNELEIMEQIESLRSGVTENLANLRKEEQTLADDLKVFDRRADELKADLEALKSQRDEVSARVDQEWLQVYNRIVARKDDALVPLNDGVCGGCHLKLPPSVMHAAVRQTAPVICDFCGRMLYQS